MKGSAPGGAQVYTVVISAASVQCGDVIQIGGQPSRVTDLIQLPQGCKQLVFDSGDLLTINPQSRLVALRTTRER
ncbi:hypothetical protein [Streptomyces sp. NPDC055189]